MACLTRLARSPLLVMLLCAAATSADEDTHWSYRPISRPALPTNELAKWERNAIDAFILQRLEQEHVVPSPNADRATLIRRVYLDLIGLLPPPDEVHAFVADPRPDAYERLVDRLLASPHYGERWARPWMDLSHYADSDGYLTDQLRPVAWRYRAWLVDALNCDMPFDQFTIETLAGDLLPDATIGQKLATGFLRQTLSNREGGADLEEFRVKQVVDRTQMIGTTWLGLTVGCARCHDHKYDEISQREYFQLYAFFDNADEVNIDAPLPEEVERYERELPDYQRRRDELIAPIADDLWKFMRRWELRLLEAYENPGADAHWDRQWELLGLVYGGGKGEGQLEATEIVKLDPAKRTWRQKHDLLDYFLPRNGGIDNDRYAELKLNELTKKLSELAAERPPVTRAPTMKGSQVARTTYIHERGDFRDRAEDVRPDTLGTLPLIEMADERPRLAFARWLVSRDHPLTARVTVNRAWQEFFGRGFVLTAEDFGAQGDRPSHPELLDWLADEFMRRDWNVKQLHRLIVTSATYRQSSRPRPELATRDPNNVWLSRQNSLRVSAEAVRDITLDASGLLSSKIGGPSVFPPQPERVVMEAFGNAKWEVSQGADRYRRSIYTFIQRTAPFAQGAIFDVPNPSETCARRERSNTPLQALTLLNDESFYEAAKALAARVTRETDLNDTERINRAFAFCLSREPSSDEVARLTAYLKAARADVDEDVAWSGLCSVLLNLHEFITRE